MPRSTLVVAILLLLIPSAALPENGVRLVPVRGSEVVSGPVLLPAVVGVVDSEVSGVSLAGGASAAAVTLAGNPLSEPASVVRDTPATAVSFGGSPSVEPASVVMDTPATAVSVSRGAPAAPVSLAGSTVAAPAPRPATPAIHAMSTASGPRSASSARDVTSSGTLATTSVALSARDLVAVEGYGTYIHELLNERDAFLTRWNTADHGSIRVWIDRSPLEGSDIGEVGSYNAVVRDAFMRWTSAGLPLDIEYVDTRREADISVVFLDRFSKPISGRTRWSHDSEGWILQGEIALSLRHPGGKLLDERALLAITLHEIGHVLGLDHVDDDHSIMAPMVRARDLSDEDRATASLLYRLPAGKLN